MNTQGQPKRLLTVDIARSLALLGMGAFHLVFDLQIFGLIPAGTTGTGFFYWHARLVAGSFLFLAGASLWLAHGSGLLWPSFWRRWIKVAGAALLVTVATWAAMPEYYVFFGILHAIALCSLLGLIFLRCPALITAAFGAMVMAASYYLPGPAFDAPLIRFLGLHTTPTLTVDFEPLFPWFGPFLLGLALARVLDHAKFLPRLAIASTRVTRAFAWPGQHSLMIYLAHQPVLLAVVWAYATLSG